MTLSILFLSLLMADPQEQQLGDVKRIFVDRLTGGESAAQIRDLIIASLQATKLFVITENQDRADTFLRGAAEDLVFTDQFSTSDGVSGNANIGFGGSTKSSSRKYLGASVSDHEASNIKERKHEALATVRLVNKDGDVIWSTTQESTGGKFRGASADVADKIAKQLQLDFEKANKVKGLPGQSSEATSGQK